MSVASSHSTRPPILSTSTILTFRILDFPLLTPKLRPLLILFKNVPTMFAGLGKEIKLILHFRSLALLQLVFYAKFQVRFWTVFQSWSSRHSWNYRRSMPRFFFSYGMLNPWTKKPLHPNKMWYILSTSLHMFQVSTGQSIPNICGTNTGQHIYVDIGALPSDTATVNFNFGNAASTNRIWDVKASQIPCGANYA